MKKTYKDRFDREINGLDLINSPKRCIDENKLQFIILVGISGSGKSTWIKTLNDFVVVCPDEIRREVTGDISNQEKNDYVFHLVYERIFDALNSNRSVIYDATNISSSARRKMLVKIRENVNNEFEALAKIFYSDPKTSIKRIENDLKDNIDRSIVSMVLLNEQFERFVGGLRHLKSNGFEILD